MSAAIAALLCLHGQLAATESAVATAVAEAKPQVYTEDELRVVFTEIDTDNSGDIDFEELKVALNGMSAVGSELTDAEVKKMLNLGDTDGDARVSFDEFKIIVNGEVTPPKKRRRWGMRLFTLLVLAALGGAGYAYQTGMIVI